MWNTLKILFILSLKSKPIEKRIKFGLDLSFHLKKIILKNSIGGIN
jgi:hypothetical protein